MPASVGPARLPSSGDKRVAGDAGAKHLRARIAGIGGQRILGAPIATAPIGSPVGAFQRRITPSAPPVSSVRCRERTRPTRPAGPGPTSVLRELARLAVDDRDRAANAGRRDQRAVGDIASAMIGVGAACNLADLTCRGDRKYTLPSAPAVTISPSAATATALSGEGSVTTSAAVAAERPDAHGHIVAGAHQRRAVRRERDAVDVLLVAFEHARRAARERPQPHRVIPRRRGQRPALGRYSKGRNRRRMTLEDLSGRPARGPDGDAAVLARSRDAAVLEIGDRVHRAVVEAQHLLGAVAASDQRIADVSKLPDRAVAVGEIASARTGPPCPRNCAQDGGFAKARRMPTASKIDRARGGAGEAIVILGRFHEAPDCRNGVDSWNFGRTA